MSPQPIPNASPHPTALVPPAEFGVIGGSGSLVFAFPAALGDERVTVLAENLTFETPFGHSPTFTHFRIGERLGERHALSVRMHGWRRGVRRRDASLQVFWVFHEAGVRKVIADGAVAALNHLLDPADIVVANDFVDLTGAQDLYVSGDHLLLMHQPICPDLSARLAGGARQSFPRVYARGTYVATEGPRFETAAEADAMRRLGGDIVGQSLAPEVFLARDIGACYAGIYVVLNYSEGAIHEWEQADVRQRQFDQSETIARIVLDTVAEADLTADCGCMRYRKRSLLDIPDADPRPTDAPGRRELST
ncbi:MAG: MTAP family purine nucleoside phosphorylase [Coriobacteriia bacterium]